MIKSANPSSRFIMRFLHGYSISSCFVPVLKMLIVEKRDWHMHSVFLLLTSFSALTRRPYIASATGWHVPIPTCIVTIIMLHFTVILTSSADSVCPGDTLVFTCVTDTGVLAWEIDGYKYVFLPSLLENTAGLLGDTMIKVNLTSLIENKTAVSTATAQNTHIDLNGSVMFCKDSLKLDSGSKNKTIEVSGMHALMHN